MNHSVSSWARAVGMVFAHLQDGADRVTDWGFAQMKKASAAKGKAAADDKATSAGKSILRFFGEAGETYYRTYEDLKTGRKKS